MLFDLADYIAAAPAVDDKKKQVTAEDKEKLLRSMETVVLETFSETTPKTLHSKASDLVKKIHQIRQNKDEKSSLVLGRRRHVMKIKNRNKKLTKKRSSASTSTTRRKETPKKESVVQTSNRVPTVEDLEESEEEKEEKEDEEFMTSVESFESDEEECIELESDEERTLVGAEIDSDDEAWNDDVSPSSRYWETVRITYWFLF